jgi:hypothetical protein
MNSTKLKSIMLAGGIVGNTRRGVMKNHHRVVYRLMLTAFLALGAHSSFAAPPTERFFTGGDYWITHLNVSRFTDGIPVPPVMPEDKALQRARTGYFLGWRGKVRFSAPDSTGAGTLTLLEDLLEHRHMVDQTHCPDCGLVHGAAAGLTFNYALGANNRITITDPTYGDIYNGVLSPDHNFIAIVNTGGGKDTGRDLSMGVKVGTAQTMDGLYAGNGLGVDLSFPTGSAVASYLHFSQNPIWVNFGALFTQYEMESAFELRDPALTTYFETHDTHNHFTPPAGLPAVLTTGPDGAYENFVDDGFWLALAPNGNVGIVASGINDIDPRWSDATRAQHHLSHGLFLRQEAAGTHNTRTVAGDYAIVSRHGSFADGVHNLEVSYGDLTLDASGTASASLVVVNDLGATRAESGTGTYTVETQCFWATGLSAADRLFYDDPVCAGGQRLDVIVLRDATKVVAKFFIGAGADVLTFIDPQSFDPTYINVGRDHTFGHAVRLGRHARSWKRGPARP